jgi:hypothetical protein
MPLLEKNIEGGVVKWALAKGFLCPKVRFVENGYPDRLFISPIGHTIFIEFKRPGKKLEPLQNYRLQQLRNRQIPAYWADTYVEAVNILKAAMESEELPETSYKAPVVASIRRAITRSRPRQDVDGPRYDKDSEAEGADKGSSDRSPSPTDDGDVA